MVKRVCFILCDFYHDKKHFRSSDSKLTSIDSVMPSNHLILCLPLLLPSIFPRIKVSSNELALGIRWPKDWSLSICPSKEYSGLISFRLDRLSLLAVQGTLKSLSNITFWKHQFFSAQPSLWSNSHIRTWLLEKPYIFPTKQTSVDKVMPSLTYLNFLMSLNILHFHSPQRIQIMFPTLLFPPILPFFLIVFHSIQAHVLHHESYHIQVHKLPITFIFCQIKCNSSPFRFLNMLPSYLKTFLLPFFSLLSSQTGL